MGRGMSKIAKKVLTYFMDGPFSFFSGNAIYPGRESAAGAASSRLLFEEMIKNFLTNFILTNFNNFKVLESS